MTTKQETILKVALRLFANEGFDAVSTKQLALEAKVSEGLIFKHFKSKKALLDVLMQDVENKIALFFNDVLLENNASVVLRKSIEIPFEIQEKDFDLWRLFFKQKWQKEFNNPELLSPFLDKLNWAFNNFRFQEPEKETGILFMLLESLIINILREGKPSQLKYKYFLIHKYTL